LPGTCRLKGRRYRRRPPTRRRYVQARTLLFAGIPSDTFRLGAILPKMNSQRPNETGFGFLDGTAHSIQRGIVLAIGIVVAPFPLNNEGNRVRLHAHILARRCNVTSPSPDHVLSAVLALTPSPFSPTVIALSMAQCRRVDSLLVWRTEFAMESCISKPKGAN